MLHAFRSRFTCSGHNTQKYTLFNYSLEWQIGKQKHINIKHILLLISLTHLAFVSRLSPVTWIKPG